jgi:ABC-type polysaccharide/polyol phosphate transport system ATPase subunit
MAELRLEGVHVRYPLFHHGRAQSLFSHMAKRASFGALGRRDASDTTFVHALRGIDLDLRDGDRVGLIGRNGAGKSTLLRVMAGIAWPHAGTRTIHGRVCNVLSAGAGLDADKTGAENVDFIGRLFAMDKAARAALVAEIADFTQLGDYMDIPLRAYSAGMIIRISFGLATALPGDILLVDELIAAGDAFFMERASARVRAMADRARILVLASHAEPIIEDFCTHALWLDQGRIVDYGPAAEVAQRYRAESARFPQGAAVRAGALAGA